jgi:predicted acylesterase/phospholipase RssA
VTDLAGADYAAATLECDVVMKGGITSGVVYPHAVCELARTYRFKSIGGTSAGAIAAAATAAAELGRARGGFERLAGLPAWIGTGSNLLDLFQPQRSTRRLYAVVRAAASGGPLRALLAAVVR